jgi:hypothetical protein
MAWNNEKWYNKRDLIWRFTLVFMKSYAGNWQINRYSRNWRNQMTEQYRTIGPEIQGFISDRRSFYRTCPSVRQYFVFTAILNGGWGCWTQFWKGHTQGPSMPGLDLTYSVDASCQVWLHLAKLFQRRSFFNISQLEKRINLGGHVCWPNGTKWRSFIKDLI